MVVPWRRPDLPIAVMSSLSPAQRLPRPARSFPLFALALGVLLAHVLLLLWLVYTPSHPQPPSKPEQRLEWVTLQKAPPHILPAKQPPEPAPAAAAAAPPRPAARPAAPPRVESAKPAPRAKPAPQPAPIRPTAPRTETQATVAPTTPAPPPAHAAQPPLASEHQAPKAPPVAASAPRVEASVTETPASYQAAYLDNPPPTYPQLSRQLGEEGTALLKVQVGPDGRPLQILLLSSTGFPRLDQSAEATVAQWRFVAATRDGRSVTSWVLVPIKFRILN